MTMRTFTYTVEAQHAEDLRATRDRTDADIRDDYIQRISDAKVAEVRAEDAGVRLHWTQGAIISAMYGAQHAAERAHPGLDLDGTTLTVTVSDLTATATLTVPVHTTADADSAS